MMSARRETCAALMSGHHPQGLSSPRQGAVKVSGQLRFEIRAVLDSTLEGRWDAAIGELASRGLMVAGDEPARVETTPEGWVEYHDLVLVPAAVHAVVA